jgi:hypothetical protein
LRRRYLVPILALAVAACEDPFALEPFPNVADTTTLYSVSRPELLGLPSAFDFAQGPRRVVVESATELGIWDILLAEEGGSFQLVPQGAVLDPSSRAGIAVDSVRAFDEIVSAAADTAAYTRHAAVPLTLGNVYVIRTRVRGTCVFYAKLEPIALDAGIGSMEFRFVFNPNCANRDLSAPDNG